MNRCPITYELCGNDKYSEKGLRMIAPKLTQLNDLPYTAAELRQKPQIEQKSYLFKVFSPS